MKIQEVLTAINQMQSDGIIECYAIGGAAGRAKDKARLIQFIESGALDAPRFQSMLARHSLADAWRKFERQFLSDAL